MTPSAADAIPLQSLETALASLLGRLTPVDTERVGLDASRGRVLAEDVRADRPSPPVDVSAMDGVAVRAADGAMLAGAGLPVASEAGIGKSVSDLPPGCGMKIFTGGPVPRGAGFVVQREWLVEEKDTVRLCAQVDGSALRPGMHIRRAGENARAGDTIAQRDRIITPAIVAALAGVGAVRPLVRRRVRVALLVTGEELVDAAVAPTPTGLRDSNGPSVAAMLADRAWIDVVSPDRVHDDPVAMREAIAAAANNADCVVTTGGVSMGDHDHVPGAVAALGGETVFHRLAIKPGKPVFAAMIDDRLLLGLPGNGVSALVMSRRVALPALARLAGAPDRCARPDACVTMNDPNTRRRDLTHFRLVERTGPDAATFTDNKGSGDVFGAARADGFVEIPPGCATAGPFDFYAWGTR